MRARSAGRLAGQLIASEIATVKTPLVNRAQEKPLEAARPMGPYPVRNFSLSFICFATRAA